MYKNKAIVIIFLAGLVLRLLGTNFGLPDYFFNSDENEYVSAVESAVLGVPSPYKTGLPINSFYYVLTVFYYLYHFLDSTHLSAGFMFAARVLSAVLSAASIVFVYQIGKNLINQKAGIIAALALAFFPVDIHIAHYVKEDVYMQFFGMLSLFYLSELQLKQKEKFAILSALFALLAGSAKLNGFFYVLPVAFYLCFLDEKGEFSFRYVFKISMYKSYLLLLILFSGLFYFVSTPISFMESDPTKKYSISALINPEHAVTTMSSSTDGLSNVLWWPYYMFSFGTGYVLTILIFISLIFVTKKMSVRFLPYYIFVVLYLVSILLQQQRFDRWITIVTPILALFVGYLLSTYSLYIKPFILGTGMNVIVATAFTLQLSTPDTRNDISNYINANVPKNEILYFQEALDPAKHYLEQSGYDVYDYSCRDINRHIDLEQTGSAYVLINMTLVDIANRFPGSEMQKYIADCANYAISHAESTKIFSNNLFSSQIYGPDRLVGPATLRYLHFPRVLLVKTKPQSVPFNLKYKADFASIYSAGFEKVADRLIAKKGTKATIKGPYIPVPHGDYRITINFLSSDSISKSSTPLLKFSVVGPTVEEHSLEINSNTGKNYIDVHLDSAATLEFPVVFNGVTDIEFTSIELTQRNQ